MTLSIEEDNPLMEDRGLIPEDHNMEQVGLGLSNLGLKKENLQINVIDHKHKRTKHKTFPGVLDADVKPVIKQREQVKRSRR